MAKKEGKAAEEKPVKKTYAVSVSIGLNLREKPNGKIIAVLDNHTKVLQIGTKGEWFNVEVGKLNGWVMAKYLKEIK